MLVVIMLVLVSAAAAAVVPLGNVVYAPVVVREIALGVAQRSHVAEYKMHCLCILQLAGPGGAAGAGSTPPKRSACVPGCCCCAVVFTRPNANPNGDYAEGLPAIHLPMHRICRTTRSF